MFIRTALFLATDPFVNVFLVISHTKTPQEVVSIEDMPTIEPRGESTFRDLGILSDRLLANVKAMGIKMPTEVRRSD